MVVGATESTQTDSTVTVNSDVTTTAEPSIDTNSQPVETKEPEIKETAVEGGEEQEQNEELPNLIAGKFKNQEELLKAYENSQSEGARMAQKLSEASKKAEIADRLEKQQLEIAKSYGFNSVDELQKHQHKLQTDAEIAKFEANQYADFLNLCESPEEVRDLLVLYAQNPSPELMKAIEGEFPIEVHKQVAEKMVQLKASLKEQYNQMEYEQEATKVKTYLENVTTQYPEEFKNQNFVSLYGEAFKALGTDLDTGLFVNLLNGLKESWISEYVSGQSQSRENEDAVKVLESLSPNQTPPISNGGKEKNILEMTPEEMKAEIRKYKK